MLVAFISSVRWLRKKNFASVRGVEFETHKFTVVTSLFLSDCVYGIFILQLYEYKTRRDITV